MIPLTYQSSTDFISSKWTSADPAGFGLACRIRWAGLRQGTDAPRTARSFVSLFVSRARENEARTVPMSPLRWGGQEVEVLSFQIVPLESICILEFRVRCIRPLCHPSYCESATYEAMSCRFPDLHP